MSSIKITTNDSQEGTIKVAFATTDLENIDSHFGSAKQFAIYEISKEQSTMCEIKKVLEKDTDKTVALLEGVDIVYFTNVGAIAAAKLINNGIFTIKYKEVVSIDEEVKKLKDMLNTNPPPFIKKIIEKKAS
ncbi:NifB/NifX family molybdenum-iron cluster-binding protein [Arcobacter sp. F2176]|uniref:NifB/NifX family molybdenum-iron cluster-binding protein n=1 Tax=unclassified Arcobacter TaxID=2593671 RepID=UPI00100AA5CD|nr:NifB/NifX family molybdenum-iron cluster-binding protein [Arcobacter sp. F2176]RXJ81556.1 dinitrogenase iron-molybdenum cofactor biosynthesis protein [Arcobacter sp. F2176]